MNFFVERVKNLQFNNALVILCTAGGAYDTQLLRELVRGYKLVDLSLPALRMQVEQNPMGFAQSLQLPAYLANLHYTPSLLQEILASELPLGKLIASCSQDYYLKQMLWNEEALTTAKVATSDNAAAGKLKSCGADVLFLDLPLTEPTAGPAFLPIEEQMEALAGKAEHRDVLQGILRGSGAWGDGAGISAYLRRVLQQDIMEQTTCSDDIKFYRFLCTAGSMAGSVINYTTLANTVGITAPTAKQWLRFLEGTGVVYLLQAVENVPGKRLMKAPKLYFRDTGVACALLQLGDGAALVQSVYFKRLYENYVVNRIRESYLQRGETPVWCFYRDSNAKEISVLLQHGGCVHPVLIDKDGISRNKLRKSFSILEGYAVEQGLALGSGCLLTAGATEKLAEGLWKVDVGVL